MSATSGTERGPRDHAAPRAWPARGSVGLALVAVSWPLTWLHPGDSSHYLFFPLWLGYILTVDALVEKRSGTSLWARSRRDFALLFVASIPAWWLFELINRRLGNWMYVGREEIGNLEYALLASLDFSTVIPAVFVTAELLRTFAWCDRFAGGPRLATTRLLAAGLFLAGAAMLAATLAWPRVFFPLTWISLVFLLEPVSVGLGRPSLLARLSRGDWRPVVALAVGALVCGFFWELWNFYSSPKWVYRVAPFEFLYVFEMPLAGYLGYLPFGLELYPLAHLLLPAPPDLRI